VAPVNANKKTAAPKQGKRSITGWHPGSKYFFLIRHRIKHHPAKSLFIWLSVGCKYAVDLERLDRQGARTLTIHCNSLKYRHCCHRKQTKSWVQALDFFSPGRQGYAFSGAILSSLKK
jgi:hypothetical protein